MSNSILPRAAWSGLLAPTSFTGPSYQAALHCVSGPLSVQHRCCQSPSWMVRHFTGGHNDQLLPEQHPPSFGKVRTEARVADLKVLLISWPVRP